MESTRVIELKLNKIYENLHPLQKTVAEVVSRIGGIGESIEVSGIAETDAEELRTISSRLLDAADELAHWADDEPPYLATLLRERFEHDSTHCGACDEPLMISAGDDERRIDHRECM